MYSSPELKRTFCMPYLSPSKHVEGPTVFQQEAISVLPGGSKQRKTFCFLFSFFLDD